MTRWTVLAALSLMLSPSLQAQEVADWTILFYGAGDNSAEESLLPDLADLGEGFRTDRGVEIIVLIDRSPKYTTVPSVFGGDFEDTRLYRLRRGPAERLSGGEEMPEITKESAWEGNLGDANTLQRFIRYGKKHFPAKRYALIFYSHGNGCTWCPDESHDNDGLFPGELSQVLKKEDSVDLIGFDVCSMGGVEIAYQFRPGNGGFEAQVMVASGSTTYPWSYPDLVRRLFPEKVPADQPAFPETPIDLGNAIVDVLETHRHQTAARSERMKDRIAEESWGCYDLRQVEGVKKALDALARELVAEEARAPVEAIRGSGETNMLHYMHRGENGWLNAPYFDLYDLGNRIANEKALPEKTRSLGSSLADAVDALVARSFGMAYFPGFQNGKHGIYVVFPDGAATANATRHWSRFRWYNALDVRDPSRSFGCYTWCRDGAEPGNGRVENWFELLDSWYDKREGGGVNGYDY